MIFSRYFATLLAKAETACWPSRRRCAASRHGTKPSVANFCDEPQRSIAMKRLLLALAGFAVYRWWNSQQQPEETSPPVKQGPVRRKATAKG